MFNSVSGVPCFRNEATFFDNSSHWTVLEHTDWRLIKLRIVLWHTVFCTMCCLIYLTFWQVVILLVIWFFSPYQKFVYILLKQHEEYGALFWTQHVLANKNCCKAFYTAACLHLINWTFLPVGIDGRFVGFDGQTLAVFVHSTLKLAVLHQFISFLLQQCELSLCFSGCGKRRYSRIKLHTSALFSLCPSSLNHHFLL